MTSQVEGEKVRRRLPIAVSDTLIVAIGSALAYMVTYEFELGYANYFRIPSDFVAVELGSVLASASALVCTSLLVVMFLNLIAMALPLNEHPVVAALARYTPLFLVLFVDLIFIRESSKKWFVISGCLLIMVSLEFWMPLIEHRNLTSYRDKLRARHRALGLGESHPERHLRLTGYLMLPMVLSVFLLVIGAYDWGQAVAARKETFMVLSNDPNMVVLGKYGGMLITARLDRADQAVAAERTILYLKDEQIVSFSIEEVGPLHVGRSSTTRRSR